MRGYRIDPTLLTEEERRRNADELIQTIRELPEPPPQRPPLTLLPTLRYGGRH